MAALCSDWATAEDVAACDPTLEGEDLASPLTLASEMLFYLSGRRWPGTCTGTLSPEQTVYQSGDLCSPSYLIDLKYSFGFPILSVSAVRLGGVVVAPADYSLVENRYLQKTEGNWELSELEIDVTYGGMPPEGGVRAAAELAGEFAKACNPNLVGKCRLPSAVVSTTRQGITMTRSAFDDLFKHGRTGLPTIDLWLSSVNPAGLSQRAKIANPDRKPGIRV